MSDGIVGLIIIAYAAAAVHAMVRKRWPKPPR